MPKLTKKQSGKAGHPPGTLLHIGEKKVEEARVSIVEYTEGSFNEREIKAVTECPLIPPSATTWINVTGIHQGEIIKKLGECFNLHPLLLEDTMNTNQRPKVEDYGEYIFIVLKTLAYRDRGISIEQVSLVLGRNWIISFAEGECGFLNEIKERLKAGKGRIRKMSPDYLAYSIMDMIVDNYFVVAERLGESIEELEEKLLTKPTPELMRSIHYLRKEMTLMRKAVWPVRDAIGTLERTDSPLITGTTDVYLRDVYDHTIRVIDTLDTYRDTVTGMLEVYLSNTSNRMNEIMKVLTVVATLFIPLTFIVGVYGMNFRVMPELEWKWGYPAIMILMAAVAVAMVVYFKRKKWV